MATCLLDCYGCSAAAAQAAAAELAALRITCCADRESAAGAVVLGVSADTADRHARFAKDYQLPFPLLADPGGSLLIRPYGVWVPVIGIASRVTFIIDKSGTIRDIVRKVDTSGHDRQVLASLEKLK